MHPTKEQLQSFLICHTNRQASENFKVSRTTIDRLIKKYNLSHMERNIQYEPPHKIKLPPKETLEYYYNNHSVQETADRFKVGRHIIFRWVNKLNIKRKRFDRDLPRELSDMQRQIINGSLLGDGCLCKIYENRANTYFYEEHGNEQLEYLRWKFDILKPFSNCLKMREREKIIRLPSGEIVKDKIEKQINHEMQTYEKFITLVKPFLPHECMKYKLT